MKPTTKRAGKRPGNVDRSTPRNGFPLSTNGETQEQDALWLLEDIDEPDAWTLASFADLLPHETASAYSG